jgi:hypothetical protein
MIAPLRITVYQFKLSISALKMSLNTLVIDQSLIEPEEPMAPLDLNAILSYNSDDILYMVTVFFWLFSVCMTLYFVNGVKINQMYIDQIKEGRTSSSRERTWREVWEFIFTNPKNLDQVS